jgi:hypothetical protein
VTELTVFCATVGQWGEPNLQPLGRNTIRRTQVTTHRINDIKTGDHGRSKSVKSSSANIESVNVCVFAVFAGTSSRALPCSFTRLTLFLHAPYPVPSRALPCSFTRLTLFLQHTSLRLLVPCMLYVQAQALTLPYGTTICDSTSPFTNKESRVYSGATVLKHAYLCFQCRHRQEELKAIIWLRMFFWC